MVFGEAFEEMKTGWRIGYEGSDFEYLYIVFPTKLATVQEPFIYACYGGDDVIYTLQLCDLFSDEWELLEFIS